MYSSRKYLRLVLVHNILEIDICAVNPNNKQPLHKLKRTLNEVKGKGDQCPCNQPLLRTLLRTLTQYGA